jgi:hypothetical protein
MYGTNGANSDSFCLNGKEVISGSGETYNYAPASGYTVLANVRLNDTNTSSTVFTKFWNTKNRFTTSGCTWESDANNSIFDAGASKQWKVGSYDSIELNGATVLLEYRCAASVAGLSSASYATLTSSVDLGSKYRYIQLRATLSTSNSGRCAPLLISISLTPEDASAPVSSVWSGAGFWA